MASQHEDCIVDSLPWATNFARSCAAKLPTYIDRDDLESVGMVAYLQAAARYDNCLGASFRGYCATRIRGAILDELRRWAWAPRSVLRNQRRLNEAQRALNTRLQREPTRRELAAEMGIALGDLETLEYRAQYRQVLSLNDVNQLDSGEEGVMLEERIADGNAAQPDAGLLSSENRKMLIAVIRELPENYAKVIVLHYLKNVPLREIATELNVTPSRVSQLHHQALDQLRRSWHVKNL